MIAFWLDLTLAIRPLVEKWLSFSGVGVIIVEAINNLSNTSISKPLLLIYIGLVPVSECWNPLLQVRVGLCPTSCTRSDVLRGWFVFRKHKSALVS